MTIQDELALQFAKFPQVTQSQTGEVTIGKVTYPCIRYTETCKHYPGTPAYARGERDYMREFIYCVGMMPRANVRGNVAFRIDGDSRDWYIASYYGNIVNRKQEVAQPNDYHPHGNMFMLAPWDIKDSTIDQYERFPYRRIAAVLGHYWVCRKKPVEVA